MELPEHGRRLLRRLRRQRDRGLLCDCAVLVGAARFPAHRAVLAACSARFRRLYRDRPRRRTVRLDGDVVSAPAFRRLLDFMYDGRLDLRGPPPEDVLAAASYLRMDDVVRACRGRLAEGGQGPPAPAPAPAPGPPRPPPPPGGPAPGPAARQAPPPPPGLRAASALPASGPPPGQSPAEPSGALDLSLKPRPGPGLGRAPRAAQEPGRPPRVPRTATPGRSPGAEEEPDPASERAGGGRPRSPPARAPAGRGPPAPVEAEPAAGREAQSPRGHLCLCPLCGQLFPSARALQPHLSAHFRARDGARAPPPPAGPAPTCPRCSKTFSCAYTLKRHARTHSGEKPYACAQCGKAFQYAHNLSRHAVVHTREKPHACRWCQRRFTQSGDLYRHVRKFHCGLAKPLLL